MTNENINHWWPSFWMEPTPQRVDLILHIYRTKHQRCNKLIIIIKVKLRITQIGLENRRLSDLQIDPSWFHETSAFFVFFSTVCKSCGVCATPNDTHNGYRLGLRAFPFRNKLASPVSVDQSLFRGHTDLLKPYLNATHSKKRIKNESYQSCMSSLYGYT